MNESTPVETIAAVATPPGRGGIGIVRLSGPLALRIGESLTGAQLSPRRAVHARFSDDGTIVDEGIVLYFNAPRSYTGEDVVELQGHGGPAVVQQILDVCIRRGARIAQAGEFTRRAFLNGRIDLAQAEAVADLIDASSRQAARSAARSLVGEFSERVASVQSQLLELRALVEAMLDFPEEEVDQLHRDDASRRLSALAEHVEELLSSGRQGSILRNGIHAVLLGEPNVGKSSLLNRLAGEERAIVTPIAGTTRDALREPILIEGVSVVLVDTAGLREGGDAIERMGIERTRLEASRAEVVVRVTEPGLPAPALPEGVDASVVDVINKIDLLSDRERAALPSGSVPVSAMTGEGMKELGLRILSTVGWIAGDEPRFLARERHLRALGEAAQHIGAARAQLQTWEFLAEELRLAHHVLGSIVGETTADDVLGQIFSRFCIGK